MGENELFLQIAKGSEEAYTTIFHEFAPRLYPYLIKIVKDNQIAKEFLQETFLRLWMHRADLKEIEEPASWLFRIAANLALGHLRKESNRARIQNKILTEKTSSSLSPADLTEGRDMEGIIRRAVESLSPKRKEVYLLSRHEGLSHKEIAQRLNLSVNTVKNHLGDALKSIRDQVQSQTGLSAAVLLMILLY